MKADLIDREQERLATIFAGELPDDRDETMKAILAR